MENPNEINEEEVLDEALDEFEENQELREAQTDSYAGTVPEQKTESNIYNWFWRVVRLDKPFSLVKVGNLSKPEIGLHTISIRDAMNLWALGHKFNHPSFGNYFATLAKITSASSMAKQGWFMDLSISQKKVRARDKSKNLQNQQPWRVFRRKGQALPED